MAEVLVKAGIRKESGWLYFVDRNGNAARVKMARRGMKTDKTHETVYEANITKEPGYLYFVDKGGNISRAKMARGGR